MTITAVAGPLAVFGATGGPGDYNPDRGPTALDLAASLMDPRANLAFSPGGQGNQPCYGWPLWGMIPTYAGNPPALTASAVAAAQQAVAGTAMTLVSVNGAGILVGQTINRADTGAAVTGLLAIENKVSVPAFGQGPAGAGGPMRIYDPTTLLARALRIVSLGDDSGATFVVRGYDIYNYPMQETITGSNAGTATGKKAFKYIASVTPAGTLAAANTTVGTTDVLGLPLLASSINELFPYYNSLVATGTFVAADTATPTATTGDVRGTFIPGSATDGTKPFRLFQTPSVANMVLGPTYGLIGKTQYATF